ncbi:CorA family divalent cation transporter [Paenibacillus beijingensis]|uniref:Magnesium transporter n=1 Tax=Paenibacillus beijingensis TaxID=1126833 RepID=A0A0D5NL01_9BACL|nr:CorA family divalent cation transporter [Paenibacillus beijingensis]AJY75662.1 hypothetical protein VN24_15230 [Paenibacillus beijingensis]
MVHRMFRYAAGWEWHLLLEERDITVPVDLPSRKDKYRRAAAAKQRAAAEERTVQSHPHRLSLPPEQLRDIRQIVPECAAWLETVIGSENNAVSVGRLEDGEPVMFGTLMIQLSDQKVDMQPLHYWVHASRLVTVPADYRLALRLQQSPWKEMFEQCGTAAEAFTVLLAVVLETFHAGLDQFGIRLARLQVSMHFNSRTDPAPVIFEYRHELLHWNRLYTPVCEIQNAAKEAFLEQLTETESFKRLAFKLERIGSLLARHADVIDTLIAMDDTMAGFRGADRLSSNKLTGVTLLLIPAAVAGTIWGLNYRRLALSDQPWGFAVMCALVFTLTFMMHRWIWPAEGSFRNRPARRKPAADSAKLPASAKARPARSASAKVAAKHARSSPPAKGRRSSRPYPGTLPAPENARGAAVPGSDAEASPEKVQGAVPGSDLEVSPSNAPGAPAPASLERSGSGTSLPAGRSRLKDDTRINRT